MLLRIERREDLYDYFCNLAIKELFPIYFVEFVIYVIERKFVDGS